MPSPRRQASALRYSGGGAPRVVATGAGDVADRILALAREAGVPVREDAALAQALAALEVDREIPAELYEAVAAALVWAYRLSGRRPPQAA